MLHSMTGFGRKEFSLQDYACSIEIKSLNGKQFELNSKVPSMLKPYEIDIRNIAQKKLARGSVDLTITLKQHGSSKPMSVNTDLAKHYYEGMMQIADDLKLNTGDILATLMRMPEVISQSTDLISEDEWSIIRMHLEETCDILISHRNTEGAMLTQHIKKNIEKIESFNQEVESYEKNRVLRIRQKLETASQELIQKTNGDRYRLEQEIIFYIEKIDITEERNRLRHHCEYFHELIAENSISKGKKLGFVLQEIGREINTMGAKANDVDIQKIVVNMKDELEQAKEQLLNAL